MSADIRFSLMVQVIQVSEDRKPFVNADVQVWNGDRHVETIKLCNFEPFQWPAEAPLGTAENHAAVAARVAARMLEDVQFEAITNGTLHHKRSYEVSAANPDESGVSM